MRLGYKINSPESGSSVNPLLGGTERCEPGSLVYDRQEESDRGLPQLVQPGSRVPE